MLSFMRVVNPFKRSTVRAARRRQQRRASQDLAPLRRAIATPVEQLETRVLMSTAPVSHDDTFSTPEETLLTGNVLLNDTDADGDSLDAWYIDPPQNGEWTWNNETGDFTFLPDTNFYGTVTFDYYAIDSNNDVNLLNSTVTIHVLPVNDAPVLATITAPATTEGGTVTFDADATDPDAGDLLTFSLEGAPDGAVIDAVSGAFSWTPTSGGSYTFDVVVRDNAVFSEEDRQTITIIVGTDAPLAHIVGAPATGSEGTAITLSSNLVDTGDSDVHSYAWTVTRGGDTFATGSGAEFSFTPDDDGTYVVTLRTTDGEGDVGSDSVSIGVGNVGPVVSILGAPESSPEGSFVMLGSATSDAGTADTHGYAWSVFKDGVLFAGGVGTTVAFIPDDNGVYTVDLVVTDDDGGTGTASATINVLNVAPTANIDVAPASGSGGPAVYTDGQPIGLSASAIDPGFGDTLTYSWDVLKNGSSFASGSGSAFMFTPDDGGTYTVRVTVSDDDGGTGTDTTSIFVIDTTVEVSASVSPSSIDEEGLVTLTGTVGGGNASGGYDVVVTWSDGTTSAFHTAGGSFSLSHQYHDDDADDIYAVTVEAMDVDGHTGSVQTTAVVRNVAPVAQITNFTFGAAYTIGTSVSFSGTFSDVGTLDTHTASFLLTSSDGAQTISVPAMVNADGTVTASYAFTTAGLYYVSLTVIDDDGGMATVATADGVDAVLLVNDPSSTGSTAGSVMGAGWYDSGVGSYAADPSLTGRAYFTCVAKSNGSTAPTGQTTVRFGDMYFRSVGYESLVVASNRATLQGYGTINGVAGYSFKIVMIDGKSAGSPDRVRIKIWSTATGAIVYDSKMGEMEDSAAATTPLVGGNIIVKS